MEKDILRMIAPGIIAFKYMLFFWALGAFLSVGDTSFGLIILSSIMIYWYWIYVAMTSFILTFMVAGAFPKKTPEEKQTQKEEIKDLFRNIPILKYLESNLYISRSISLATVGLVLVALNELVLMQQFNSLMMPFIIGTLSSIAIRIIE